MVCIPTPFLILRPLLRRIEEVRRRTTVDVGILYHPCGEMLDQKRLNLSESFLFLESFQHSTALMVNQRREKT